MEELESFKEAVTAVQMPLFKAGCSELEDTVVHGNRRPRPQSSRTNSASSMASSYRTQMYTISPSEFGPPTCSDNEDAFSTPLLPDAGYITAPITPSTDPQFSCSPDSHPLGNGPGDRFLAINMGLSLGPADQKLQWSSHTSSSGDLTEGVSDRSSPVIGV